MPNAFDPTNIPAEYQQTSQLAEDQLTKLEASDQKVLGPESSTLHLLSSGLTSQTKVLNSLIDKLDSFQLKAGSDLGTDVQDQFDRHVNITRKLQKSAMQTSLKDQGLLPETENIQLICSLYAEETSSTNTVNESAIKNLHSFTGENDSSDVDLKCEQFIDTALDIAVSNKLSHVGCKNLILRKISGYANLVLQTYLDNQSMSTTVLTLQQLLGFLEKTFRAQSTPEIALHRLQNLPEIRNKNFLQPCGVIARLAKLSCRSEKDEATRNLIFQSRAREYLLKSLQQDDRGLIQAEDSRRLAENKPALSFLAISEFLTKYHQLKTKPTASFQVNQVAAAPTPTDDSETSSLNEYSDNNPVYYIDNRNRGGMQKQFSNNYRGRPVYRGQMRPPLMAQQRRNYSNNYNHRRGGFRGGTSFQNPHRGYNTFQARGKQTAPRPLNSFSSNAKQVPRANNYQGRRTNFHSRITTSRGRGTNNQSRGQHSQLRGRNYRGKDTNYQGQGSNRQQNGTNRQFVTPEMVNLEPNRCLNCGSTKHLFNSRSCPYWPQPPNATPCTNHHPPKYGHLRETCLGDFTAHQLTMDNEENDENF